MYYSLYILFFGIFLVLCTRLIPKLVFKNITSPGNDFWNLLLSSKAIKSNNHKIPDKIDNFLLKDNMDYPPLIPWIFSYISDKYIWHAERLFPFLVDSLYLFFFWLLYIFNVGILSFSTNNSNLLLSIILFTVHPLFFIIGRGPRTYHTTPRTLSELLVFGYIFFILCWINNPDMKFLLFAIIFGLIQTICNRFGNQVILLVSLGLGIIYNSILVIFLPLIILLLSFIVWGRIWGRLLMGTLGHAIFMRRLWYHPNRVKSTLHQKKTDKRHYIIKILSVVKSKELLMTLISSPAILFIIFSICYYNFNFILGDNILIKQMLTIIILLIIIGIIFDMNDLKFWGTGDRYIYYTIPFQIILLNTSHNIFLKYFIALSFVLSFVYLVFSYIRLNNDNKKYSELIPDDSELHNFINNYNDRLRILPIWGARANKLIYYTNCFIPDIQYSYKPWLITYKDVLDIYSEYSYVNPKNIDKILEKYNIKLIVVRKEALTYAIDNFNLVYDFNKYKVGLENNSYIVYIN